MEVPEDLFQHDMSTFPTEDPAVTKQREAMEEKLRKAEEAAQRKHEQSRKKEQQVVEKLVKTAPPTASAKQAKPEDISKRIALKKHKLLLYFQHFSAKLSCKAPKTLPDDETKLDELLETVRNDLGSKGGIEQAGNIYIAAVSGLERLNPLGLNLSGPQASLAQTALRSKQAWNDLVTEVAIDNAEWFVMGPVKRLIAVTVQMMMAVHQANNGAQQAQQPVPPEVVEKSKDL